MVTKKSKQTDLFQNDLKIIEFNKKISELHLEKQKLEKDLQLLTENFQEKNKEEDLSKLPLQSIKDLHDFESGEKINFTMNIFDDRIELRKTHQKKLQDLQNLDKMIASHELDLLLAKIDCVNSFLQ